MAHVFVIGDDDSLHAFLRNLNSERSYYIVSLKPWRIDDRDIEGLAQANDIRELRCQVVGHLQPVGFVIRKGLMAKRLLARLKDCGDVLWLFVLQQFAQHVCEDENCLCDLAP